MTPSSWCCPLQSSFSSEGWRWRHVLRLLAYMLTPTDFVFLPSFEAPRTSDESVLTSRIEPSVQSA